MRNRRSHVRDAKSKSMQARLTAMDEITEDARGTRLGSLQ